MLSHLLRPALARRVGVTGVLLAALALAGCSRGEPPTYGYAAATSIKDTWAPVVKQAPVKKLTWAPVVKPVRKAAVKPVARPVAKAAPAKTAHAEPPRPAEPSRVPEVPRAPARVEPPRAPAVAPVGCGSDAACLAQLKALIDDPQRAWIGKPQPMAEYAKGIRLFAYRALHTRLTCGEIGLALAEIETAIRTLDGPAPGVPSAQVDGVRMLSVEVEDELRAERAKRCIS